MLRRVGIGLAAVLAVMLALPLVVRFRRKSVARFNRAFTNRITRRFAGRARSFGIIIHRGRKSGRVYRTPVNVFEVPEGFLIALTYGRESEWVQNVLAEGGCMLENGGRLYQLFNPVIVHDPRHRRLPLPLRVIPLIGGVTDYLRLSVSRAPSVSSSPDVSDGAAANSPRAEE
jgi:deazaflavin-dependent oxidoreductase (nitroreductase family)